MEQITNIISFVRSIPGGDIALLVSGIVTVASVIVKWTPTQKDDAILGKIIGFLSKYIALNK